MGQIHFLDTRHGTFIPLLYISLSLSLSLFLFLSISLSPFLSLTLSSLPLTPPHPQAKKKPSPKVPVATLPTWIQISDISNAHLIFPNLSVSSVCLSLSLPLYLKFFPSTFIPLTHSISLSSLPFPLSQIRYTHLRVQEKPLEPQPEVN